ncbi:MAG: methionine--tRNA ligase subunit beta [Nanoarchaeota archaeon]
MTDKIPFTDFEKVDLRVGTILEVENHPKADKLYVLKVDLGEDSPRTIVAGLRPHYTHENLKGKQAIFVVNLEPVNLRGIESNGMILAASNQEKTNVFFLKPDKQIAPGSKIH